MNVIDSPRAILLDPRTPKKVIDTVEKMNIVPLFAPIHPLLEERCSGHPDMTVHVIDRNTFVVAPELYAYYEKIFLPYSVNLIMGNTRLTGSYPKDIAYNVGRVGKFAFHLTGYTDAVLQKHFDQCGIRQIGVRQGYSGCAMAVVGDRHIMTEDRGIAQKATEEGLEVLLLQGGFFLLNKKAEGFVGGACGMIKKSTLAFAGDIALHPQWQDILKFLNEAKVKAISLSDHLPTDIGSIIPIF